MKKLVNNMMICLGARVCEKTHDTSGRMQIIKELNSKFD